MAWAIAIPESSDKDSSLGNITHNLNRLAYISAPGRLLTTPGQDGGKSGSGTANILRTFFMQLDSSRYTCAMNSPGCGGLCMGLISAISDSPHNLGRTHFRHEIRTSPANYHSPRWTIGPPGHLSTREVETQGDRCPQSPEPYRVRSFACATCVHGLTELPLLFLSQIACASLYAERP